ncbi:metal-dependent hydrolase, TIM barrel fold protein [Arthrobacter crystallopoietes BAB-32]|uniref:Metal-dependent hydrolase, TIM barrel fold protein n=1 Tax=Arthrobacter crystallopoietes BAB-32 TaxID=1246476 RepID=N1UXA3_9MICC|nr:amidohydrolase [Arthrobacter crystallopoietes]EMY35031.1 metal-dependent hydrolase, TIM barrel fold protein [Arthrobacter crystallopoietes BAB-32]
MANGDAVGLLIANATLPEGARANVAVSGGAILAVGGDEVLELVGPSTRVIDADGGAVLPGVNDGHLHFIASAMAKFGYLNVGASVASNWRHVETLLADAAPGADGWIRAHGWDEVVLGPGGEEVVRGLRPDAPVVVFDQTGHQLLANQTAMAAAGVGQSPAVPSGGVIGRTALGEPNGLFVDAGMELITAALPPVPRQALRTAALKFQRLLHAQGITSLTEPGLGPGGKALIGGACTTDALELLGDLAAGGELTLRISALLLFAGTGGVSTEAVRAGLASGLQHLYTDRGIDPQLLRIAGVKVFADGTPRSGTAWMSEPYGRECNHGSLVVAGSTDAERVSELHEIVRLIHEAGLQAGVHATGDAATESAVDAIIAAQRDGRIGRHYIIHGAFRSNASLGRLARHEVGYSTNPAIRAAAGDLMKRLLGEERYARHQPLQSALRAGVKLNIASDSPVTDTDWRRTIAAAVTRDTVHALGRPDDPGRLTSAQALLAMTALPAWQDHAEDAKGSLAPGMAADLCVLDGPWPSSEAIDELAERKVAWTIARGGVVHEPGWVTASRRPA